MRPKARDAWRLGFFGRRDVALTVAPVVAVVATGVMWKLRPVEVASSV
ncbi:MAG: hypothetical protein AB1938_15070 [Myxococcota bacterium]